MSKYKFKTTPYEHQRKALEKSWNRDYYGLFMEMGTGKSKVSIDTMGILYHTQEINAALVIAPKGVYANWVQKEIPSHLSEEIDYKMVQWKSAKTQAFEKTMVDLITEPTSKLKILVMNTEAFSTPRGVEVAKAYLYHNPNNLMIVDESSTIKNRAAARTKNILSCAEYTKYRRILTGSPITKSPLDLFSQCNFLSKEALGYKSFFAFRGRYAEIVRRTMGHKSFQEIKGYKRLDELSEKIEEFSHRVLKKDCLDLPEKIYTQRSVPLTKEQEKAYVQMKQLALAMLEDGELSTTASVLTQIMRLQQICCGHITTDEGETQTIKSNRLNSLLEVIEETSGKVIIWANFTHDILAIEDALKKAYKDKDIASSFYGATAQDDRQEIVNRFQDPDSPLRFFIGQPKTGGYGLTLTEANTVIYYSNSYDLELRLQSEDRAHRIGQKKPVTYIDLISPKTIDEKILEALQGKVNLAGQVLKEEVAVWFS